MLNLSDNELDKLSREAAEKFEPAENAQSWNKLEQLLDKNIGKPSPVPKITKPGIPFIYSGAILIAISAIYFLTKSKKDINNSTLQNSTSTNQQLANKNSQRDSNSAAFLNKKQETGDKIQDKQDEKRDLTNNEKRDKKQENQADKNEIADKEISNKKENNQAEKNNLISEGTRTKEQDEQDKKNDLVNVKSINNKQANKNEIANKETRDKEQGKLTEKNITEYSPKGKNKDNKIDVEKSANKNSGKNNLSSSNNLTQQDYASAGNQRHHHNAINHKKNKNNIEPSNENENELNLLQQNQQDENLKFASVPGISFLGGTLEEINDSALRNFNTKTQLSNIINAKKHRAAFVNRSLQIGFLFAPEFSKVKYIYNNNRVGNNLGITLSYQLFGKLSLNSGVIFSKKYYQADEKQFHGPQNAAGSNFAIEFVNASANVIDIPLNLRYNYFSDGNSTFFVNGGFSSYIMKKENFDYYCHYYNGGFQYQGWVRPQPPSSLQKNYLFSIVNLSAGFETSISNSFSFQFEPYMKLPIKGIGFGKVDLSSYGINMSVKYSPILKRGRR